jgi:hypothetical protein
MPETIHGFERGEWVKGPFDEYGPGKVLALSEARMKRLRPVDPRFVYVEHRNGSVSSWFSESLRHA